PPPDDPKRRVTPLLVLALVVVAAAVGAFVMTRPDGAPSNGAAAQTVSTDMPAAAKLGPHTQAHLPPIPFQAFAPPRPPDVVRAAYLFAAEPPEILSYVPCFCGCERGG